MNPRAMITNAKFAYQRDSKSLKYKLKYFQHRNDKDGASHVKQFDAHGKRVQRWVDGGLGSHYREIFANCLATSTKNLKNDISARLFVFAPETHLIEAIDPTKRVAVMRELTHSTLDLWFDKMDLPTPEYAFVIHESSPSDRLPDGQMKSDKDRSDSYLHAHVIVSATVEGLEKRENYWVFSKQIHQLHEAGREALASIWTRELGAERVAELDLFLDQREQLALERGIAPPDESHDVEHELGDL